jgi:hypothetical protein
MNQKEKNKQMVYAEEFLRFRELHCKLDELYIHGCGIIRYNMKDRDVGVERYGVRFFQIVWSSSF